MGACGSPLPPLRSLLLWLPTCSLCSDLRGLHPEHAVPIHPHSQGLDTGCHPLPIRHTRTPAFTSGLCSIATSSGRPSLVSPSKILHLTHTHCSVSHLTPHIVSMPSTYNYLNSSCMVIHSFIIYLLHQKVNSLLAGIFPILLITTPGSPEHIWHTVDGSNIY